MNRIALFIAGCMMLALAGCEQKPPAPPAGGGSNAGAANPRVAPSDKPSADGAQPDAGRAKPPAAPGHGGEIVELGTAKIGELTVRASRDKGEIKAGGDAPIDVWLTTADGKPAAVTAVRFWIGSEDAKGSIKAKAEIEDPKQPNHWHTHAEVPSPLPDGAKLWVEIEEAGGKKTAGSFDLKK